MNFHKTIGFLATLLLTLGLGVPDSFAQAVTVSTITLAVDPASIEEGATPAPTSITVTVNLSDVVEAGDTYTVQLGKTMASGPILGSYAPALPSTVTATVVAGDLDAAIWIGNHTYTPPPIDDDPTARSFSLEAKIGMVTSDPQVISITHAAGTGTTVSAGSVVVELNGEEAVIAEEGGSAIAITVVVEALVNGDDVKAGYSRPVTVSLADGGTLNGTFDSGLSTTTSLILTAEVTADLVTEATTEPDTARATTVIRYTPADEDADEAVSEASTIIASTGDVAATGEAVTENDINIITSIAVTLDNNANLDVSEDSAARGVLLEVDMVLAQARAGGKTWDVTVSLAEDDEVQGTLMQGSQTVSFPLVVTATVPGAPTATATTATGNVVLTFTPEPDSNTDPSTVTLSGSVAGETDDDDTVTATTKTSATLTVTDNDTVSEIAIELDPAMVKDSAGETDITVAVTVTFADATAAANAIAAPDSVVLTGSGSGDFTISGKVPLAAVTGEAEQAEGSLVIQYTPPGDADSDDSEAMVTGSLSGQTGMATLTVDDDDVAVGDITIAVSPNEIRENVRARDVTVTATLSAGNTGPLTVMVETEMIATTPEAITTTLPTGTITIGATESSNTTVLSINPSDDDVFTTRTIRVTGSASAAGYNSGFADITVLDNDNAIGDLTITAASPPSVTTGTATNVIVTVKGLLFDKLEDSGTVVATLTTTLGSFQNTTNTNAAFVTVDPNNPQSAEVSIAMADHVDLIPDQDSPDGTRTITLTLTAADAATEGTMITVTASADMYNASERVIPVTSRVAADNQGYRAVLVTPAENGWAIIGNDKVKVDLMRVGSVAYPWSQFTSIKVSVRDTAHDNSATPHEIDAVTARNFNLEDNGSVTFEEPGGRSRGDVIWRGNDTIRFEIRIRPRDDQGSTDPARNGQYLGAYVHIELTSASGPTSFTNLDSDKAVYPSNPTLVDEANRYKGDGKLFKVDNLAPSNAAIASVRVTSRSKDDVEEVDSGITATLGDEIRVAIKVSGNVLFRDTGIRVQVRPVDGTGTAKGGYTYPAGDVAPQAKTINFSAAQVIAAANDSLRAIWTVNENFFRFKTDNYVEGIGRQGVFFQPDEALGEVLVQVKDQAGNFSGNAFAHSNANPRRFSIDSRAPGVRIRYPAADPDSIYDHTHPLRFTGHTADDVHGYSEFLNPLVVEVDEDLSKLEVFAVGADTLNITGQFSASSVGDSTVTYETFDLSSPVKDGEGDDDKYPGKAYVPSSANIAGTDIELAVLATDAVGQHNQDDDFWCHARCSTSRD